MNFGSLFAGIGGFCLGFQRSGLRCAWQVELDPRAQKVLRHRWPDVPQWVYDIRATGGDYLKPVDVICGGFPCQDLSVAGRRAGLSGERSGMFFEMLRVIDEIRPPWVVWENVPGILSSRGGICFTRVLRGLADIGYFGAWRTLNAQFFGVPQRRRRVFGVFSRDDPTGRRGAEILALTEGVCGDPPAGSEATPEVAGTLGGGSGNRAQCHGSNVGPLGTLRSGNGSVTGGVPFLAGCDTTRECRRNDPSQETLFSHTLISTCAKGVSEDGSGRGLPITPTEFGVRRLTPIECLRLQGFPDDWLEGLNLSDAAKYRLIGNAVAVPVAAWIGRRLSATAGNYTRSGDGFSPTYRG